jgi:hypothetical protein
MNAFGESVASFFVVRHGETKNDLRLPQALIDRLYRSRALRPNQVPRPLDTPEAREDERRCTKSVLTTRDLIAFTRWREIGVADLRNRTSEPPQQRGR